MSGIINKVKDAISGHHDESKDHAGHTAGPHNTDTANRVDPRVDSNQTGYGNTTQTGTHGTSGLGSSEYGSTGTGYGNTGTTTTAGPHNSNIANKADPRVDSDLDGSRTAGGNTGYGTTGTGSSTLGSGTTGSTGYGSSNTTGPHNSNIANKLDPRVDSQTGRVDITNTHQGRTGNYDDYTSNTTGTGTQGSSTLGGSGYGQSGTTGYGSSTTGTGPHNSNIANKLDPRVDSTTGQQTGTGYGSTGQQTGTGYGTTGQQTGTGYDSTTGVNQGTHGHHHGHHKAEEAGVVGAAAYGAEHEHNKHQHGNTGYDSTTGVNQGTHEHHHGHHGNHRAEEAGVAGTAAYGAEHERKLPHDSGAGGLASKISPLGSSTVGGTKREGEYTNTGSASTAYERNALGGFSDGAGGTAGHGYSDTNFGEATRGQQNTRDDMGQTSSSTGPHSSNLLNKLDPRVKNDSENTTNTGRYE